jgi:hypothetical protein
MVSGDAVRDLINSAVLAEREAIIADMQEEISRCENAIAHGSLVQDHKQSIFQLKCEIAKIRARTTNTEIAAAEKPNPAVVASLPSTEGDKDRAQRPLTYGQLRQQIEAEHPDDPRHYGAAKIARIEAEWKASPPWVRWAAVISDAICASSSVPLHYKHAVSDAMDALPLMPEEKAPKP